MITLQIKHVDAFTANPFGGNPAGVVLNGDGLSDELMQQIAREMNLSETAFVLTPTEPKADIRIRWFTPTHEVDLCGHATVAAFHALAEEGLAGMKTNGQHYFRVQTRSGILSVRVEKNFHGICVEFQLPVPVFRKKRTLPPGVLSSLGLSARDLAPGLPVVVDRDLFIPVRSLNVMGRLRPKFAEIAHWSARDHTTGVCVFTLETVDKESSVHSRFFAPSVGINEDPVTGSANGPLGSYLQHFAVAKGIPVHSRSLADGRIEYLGEQGDEIGRRGRVKIRLRMRDSAIDDVAIAGEAVTICTATSTSLR